VVEQEIRKIRTNQEHRELCTNLYIVADIKRKTLEWTGHIVRMDQGRTDKKIFESKLEGSRRKGRPRLRWLEDMQKDQWEKVKRWRYEAVDRENGRR